MENVSKFFPGGVVALDNVSISIQGGKFTAILGENGAGKTTLVKILYGIYTPDTGVIKLNNKRISIENPLDAIKKGIVMVSQIPQLIDRLTVAENISLSLSKVGLLSRIKNVSKILTNLEEKIGMKIDPNAKVWSLSYTQKQFLEIIRAMLLDAKVLLLDEALTYLPHEERRKFYQYLKEFREKNRAVVFITHKIPEALEIADEIHVLRKGRLVGTLRKENANLEIIRELMFGEAAKAITYERFSTQIERTPSKVIIEIKNLHVLGDYGEQAVNDASMSVRAGEIVGIAGVVGNGQRELIEAVAGFRRIEKGGVILDGEPIIKRGLKAIRELGVGFIPDQPLRYAVSSDNNIVENVAALFSRRNHIVNWAEILDLTSKLIKEFSIYPPRYDTMIKLLSGGNMMKVVVARELTYAKKALIAYNPTRGLDEATSCLVRRKIHEKATIEKTAVLFASEDLDEILQLSDIIYVMNRGKLYGPFNPLETPRADIEKLMVM